MSWMLSNPKKFGAIVGIGFSAAFLGTYCLIGKTADQFLVAAVIMFLLGVRPLLISLNAKVSRENAGNFLLSACVGYCLASIPTTLGIVFLVYKLGGKI